MPSPRLRRRSLLQALLFAALSQQAATACHSRPRGNLRDPREFEVIVIGAGIAGLAAAQALQAQGRRVLVLEARDRLGGRIWTNHDLGFPIDLGAAWIHGNEGNPLLKLAAKAEAPTFATDDASVVIFDANGQPLADAVIRAAEQRYYGLLRQVERWAEELDQDVSLAAAIARLDPQALSDPLLRYHLNADLEFDLGGSIEDLSAWYWEDDEAFPGQDLLLPQGFEALIQVLAAGLDIRRQQVVERIDARSPEGVTVDTERGQFQAAVAIATLPLGLLKQQTVEFLPPLPEAHQRAIARLGIGAVNKVVMRFPTAFWDETIQYFGNAGGAAETYTYWINGRRFRDQNVLIAIASGQPSLAHEARSDQEITAEVTALARRLFGPRAQPPEQVLITRWRRDPFAGGAYSYAAVGSTAEDFVTLATPVAPRVLLAGEHTHRFHRGAAHGAYASGRRAAQQAQAILGRPGLA